MGLDQQLFQFVAGFDDLVLALLDIADECRLAFAVADLAGLVDVVERALNLVIGEFDTAFGLVGHMAIGTGYAALTVNALVKKGVTRVRGF